MATIAEQLTSLANTKTAIKDAIVAKGVTVADDTPFSGYAAKIGEIQGGGGAPATKFGLTIDDFLYDLNDGAIQQPKSASFDGSAIREVLECGLGYRFAVSGNWYPTIVNQGGIDGVLDLRNVTTVGIAGLEGICLGNILLTEVRLDSLEVIDKVYSLSYSFKKCIALQKVHWKVKEITAGVVECFSGCRELKETGLDDLEEISGGAQFNDMYAGCTSLTETGLTNLMYISKGSVYSAGGAIFNGCTGLLKGGLDNLIGSCLVSVFSGCTGLTKEYFPMLTDVYKGSFKGISSSSYAFYGCKNITELHFRADMQATIESCTGYSSKFGATNATIYFDLIGTITVNGVAYARDEKQSIRVDGVKTFVGWKDENENVIYTSYENNAEPAVGTTVYSDAGTTQVGTVEGVA